MSTKGSLELVLFVGPPFTGKTLFYREHLADSHTRIVPSERFDRSVSIGLPHIIREVIQHLKRGRSVVIDDLNWVKSHRNNYWKKVKEKVPSCSLRCLVFQPVFGIEQCLWSWQWWCADHFADHTKNEQLFQTQLNLWFNRRAARQCDVAAPELPSPNEPCTVENVKAKLVCSSSHEWRVPALFVQWSSLIAPGSALSEPQVCQGVVEACRLWAANHPDGRIIAIADTCHGKETEVFQERVTALLKEIVYKIDSHPVYYLLIEEKGTSGEFLPPKPGLLAWLQKAHMLSLLHKDTLYICSSADHRLSAGAAGVCVRMASELAHSPSLVSAVNFSHGKHPGMLQELKLVDCGLSSHTSNTPALPLFEKASCVVACPGHFAARSCNNFVHGLVWKDHATLNNYHLVFCDSLVPLGGLQTSTSSEAWEVSEEPSLPLLKRADSSGHSLHRIPLHTPHCATSKQFSPAPSKSDTASPVDEFLKVADVRSVAANDKIYSNGVATRGRVKNLLASISSDHMVVTAQCEGSDKQTYNLQAHITRNGVVPYFHCTCPFHKRSAGVPGSSGCCKHVVAALLEHNSKQDSKRLAQQTAKDKVQQTVISTEQILRNSDAKKTTDFDVCEVEASKAAQCKANKHIMEHDKVPSLGRQQTSLRALPSWLSPSQAVAMNEAATTSPTTLARVQMLIKPRKHKRRSTQVVLRKTRYQMNEQELLQTALEVLKQSGVEAPACEEELLQNHHGAQQQSKHQLQSPGTVENMNQSSDSEQSICEGDAEVMECLFGPRKRRRSVSDEDVMALVETSESEDDAELRCLLFGEAVERKLSCAKLSGKEDSNVTSPGHGRQLAELLFGSGSSKSNSGSELVGVTLEEEEEKKQSYQPATDRCFVPDSFAWE